METWDRPGLDWSTFATRTLNFDSNFRMYGSVVHQFSQNCSCVFDYLTIKILTLTSKRNRPSQRGDARSVCDSFI